MQSVLKDRPLLFHHIEWVLMHPRFGVLMLALIAASFTHNPALASVLFVVFSIEIGLRIAVMRYKIRTNPYRSSLNSKLDALFLVLDIIGVASLLITMFHIPLDAQDAAAARLLRAFYLMRTLRAFRYIDLQSAMFSPTYGMFISLVILLSFFAHDTLMWVIIIFFSVELAIRLVLMRHMDFENRKERVSEWVYWWIDLVATVVMIPAFAVIPHGSALRALRLIRLLRPWLVIVRNLREVIREGQFMQEVNLVILLLGVLAILGGVIGRFLLPPFDYTQDGVIDDADGTLFAQVWFAFRLFTDPGNSIAYPPNAQMAVESAVAVIVGVFIFAFFIGIGAQVVSGLMEKLRNERLNVSNHMVMLGWSQAAPYILNKLHTISERQFARLKLVLLGDSSTPPEGLLDHPWVSYRWGNVMEVESLRRVNLNHARQAIVNVPDNVPQSTQLAHSMFSLLAIRNTNPGIYLNYASPSLAHPQLSSHHHILQIGWDNQQAYDKPTVVMSQAEVRANMLRNILVYQDFDQVMERLMIPERTEESALQICEWEGEARRDGDRVVIRMDGADAKWDMVHLAASMLPRGVTLVALVDESGTAHPLYKLMESGALAQPMRITAALGLAIQPRDLHGELVYAFRKGASQSSHAAPAIPMPHGLALDAYPASLRVAIVGWAGSLPLILKRMLNDFDDIHVTIIDQLTPDELAESEDYLRRRIREMPGAEKRIHIKFVRWNFIRMDALREHVRGADRIILSRPQEMPGQAYMIIATVLSHLITIVREHGDRPQIFPLLQDRRQARLLQEELDRFDLPTEVHVTVPDEYYGAYIAHTSFHMFASENQEAYELQRTLRHAIDKLMCDVNEDDDMDLRTITVRGDLPEDAGALFAHLLERGHVWIGYRLHQGFEWHDPVQDRIRKLFPREHDFSCLRQYQIILNPFGNPVSRYSWLMHRPDIAELIVITDQE